MLFSGLLSFLGGVVWEVSVTTDSQLNKSLVSLAVQPYTPRPEYQTSLGSRLHGKRCSGDYTRRRHWERPSWPDQQLCKSLVFSKFLEFVTCVCGNKKQQMRWEFKNQRSDMHTDPFLYGCLGCWCQLWCKWWRCWPSTKIHTAKWKQVIWQKRQRGNTETRSCFRLSCQT